MRSNNAVVKTGSPVHNFLVGGKDDGGSLIGVADECEEPIGLTPGNRCVANLVNNEQLRFLQVFQSEPGSPFRFCGIQYLYQIYHFLEADGVTAVPNQ